MARLEDRTRGAAVRGILPNGIVNVLDIRWYGTAVVELTYKDASGRPGNQLPYRDDEARLEVVTAGRPWSFDADGALLRLVSEAQRIRLAHLFDPYLAVHTSQVEPLPHQISGVYDRMLQRQPLRFLLADDPGAGKTIARPEPDGMGADVAARAVTPRVTARPRSGEATPPEQNAWRSDGTVELAITRFGSDGDLIAVAIIPCLYGLIGAQVNATLEIEADLPDGAPDNVVRTVSESARTLRFKDFGFEEH